MTSTSIRQQKDFFASLLTTFCCGVERNNKKFDETFLLGYKAENDPELLTIKEAFTISRLLENIQDNESKKGNQENVLKLEELKDFIYNRLS